MNQFDEVIKVRIHAGSEQVWQEVYAFLVYQVNEPFHRTVDVFIKMPLYLIPDDIRTDVSETLRSHFILEDIENLKYTLSPEIL